MKYMNRRGLKLFAVAALLTVISSGALTHGAATPAVSPAAVSMSVEDQATAKNVEQLVRNFLAKVPKNDPKAFQEFFADDVIYTRAAGVTVTKSDILKNIDVRATNEPQATYDGDDFTVHPYGNMAVVNFRLIQHNGAQTNYFRNTGTFLQRNGKWQVVAWQATNAAEKTSGPEDLQHLLAQMNTASKGFNNAQADFQWDSFQMVVQETTVQKGKMFLRRTSKGMDAALHVTSPDPTQVVFKNCELSFYQPKIEQVTQRNACENRADVESFMSLGFGASGDDLTKKYTVTMEGWETAQGVKTAKLNLVPKDEKVKSSLSKVILWIDPARSLAVQQKFMEPSGDYRLAKYSNIKVNSKISDDEFKLKTTSKTKFVKP